MAFKRHKSAAAFTIIEVMLAVLILSVAILGTSGYRYYTALDSRDAGVRTEAARIALLLCENWKGIGGDENYDPTVYFASDMSIAPVTSYVTPQHFATFNALGIYRITSYSNNIDYQVAMAWRDVATGLRALNVVVAWESRASISQRGDQYSAMQSNPHLDSIPDYPVEFSFSQADTNNRVFRLTAYTTTN